MASEPTVRIRDGSGRRASVLTVLLVLSVSANIWLARSLVDLQKRVRPLLDAGIAEGTQVASFTGREATTGRTDTIAYAQDGRPTVLYVFSPKCHWCKETLPDVKTLAAQKGGAYRFVGVSLAEGDLPRYVQEHELPFPVYSGLSHDTIREYQLGPTPQTIVVSPTGRVLKSWRGAFLGSARRDVESYFGVRLPSPPSAG
jgi:thiol-disulfide isomerase/thioredoxin